jgi:hypothetical protein
VKTLIIFHLEKRVPYWTRYNASEYMKNTNKWYTRTKNNPISDLIIKHIPHNNKPLTYPPSPSPPKRKFTSPPPPPSQQYTRPCPETTSVHSHNTTEYYITTEVENYSPTSNYIVTYRPVAKQWPSLGNARNILAHGSRKRCFLCGPHRDNRYKTA